MLGLRIDIPQSTPPKLTTIDTTHHVFHILTHCAFKVFFKQLRRELISMDFSAFYQRQLMFIRVLLIAYSGAHAVLATRMG
jgi:hypothetical protein